MEKKEVNWVEEILKLNKPKRAKAPSDNTNEKGKIN